MMMVTRWKNGDGGAFHRRIMYFLLMLGLSFFTGVEPTTTTTSSLSSILMQHSNNLCFVNQYPMCNGSRKRGSNPFSSSSSRKFAPFLDKSATTSKRAFQQQQRGSIIMRGNNDPNNNNNTFNQQKQQQQVIPTILMYTLVPFLPSITIQSLNDHYQQIKQQFNLAAASLTPPPSSSTTGATTAVAVVKDSIEYITASNLYNESMHSLLILLLSKRVALYFIATMATVYAGWRASLTMGMIERGGDGSWLSGPGMALDYLNREVLKGETSALLNGKSGGDNDDEAIVELDSDLGKEEEEDDKLFATLVDDSPQSAKVGGTIALILPLVLGGSLALSYSLISFFKDGGGGGGVDGSFTFSSFIGDEYLNAIQGLLPYLTSIPSMILCVLFVATEFRSVSRSSTSTNTSSSLMLRAENIAALLYCCGAYIAKVYPTITIGGEWNLDLGPLQNGVNIAFAATVVRALSPFLISYTSTLDPSSSKVTSPISIRTIALALIGVTMFDGISVFGTVANAATTTVDTTTTATSVMETVATYKADAQLWNPGLLSVIVGHNQNAKITEALGLGDVVFPACLVAWGFFADAISTPTNDGEEVGEEMPKRQISYTTATIAGYVVGSAATEIVGSFSLLGGGRGLPALIFLIPSMLIAVTAVAASRGELNEVWGSSGVAESNASD